MYGDGTVKCGKIEINIGEFFDEWSSDLLEEVYQDVHEDIVRSMRRVFLSIISYDEFKRRVEKAVEKGMDVEDAIEDYLYEKLEEAKAVTVRELKRVLRSLGR